MDIKSLLFLPLPLVAACYGGERYNTGECPAGETCSTLTPKGLQFIGNELAGELSLSGPRPTAIGGTQAVALQYDRGDGVTIALDLPYTADDNGGRGITVAGTSGSQVTVRGAGSFSNYLRILDEDGLLMDRKELTGAALSTMELVPVDYEAIPADMPLAWAKGTRKLAVALYGDVQTSTGPRAERLVDTAMQLSFAGAQRTNWDTLQIDAQVGSYLIGVTAGDKPAAALDFIVVDHADSVAVQQNAPSTISPNNSTTVCFSAVSGSRYVAGLTWTYQVDGVQTTKGDGTLQRNCIAVSTAKTTGTVSVSAAAGGQSTAMALTVGAARTTGTNPAHIVSHAIATEGDRAAM